jgi:hypothetical protein
VEENGVHREKHESATDWQTLQHNVVSPGREKNILIPNVAEKNILILVEEKK